MNKHYLLLILFFLASVPGYSQPHKVVVKMGFDSDELRYWPLDGKHLPYYDLASVAGVGSDKEIEIILPEGKSLFKVIAGGKSFEIYSAANSVDTVYLQKDTLSFSGKNKLYNQYLVTAEKSDQYCWDYIRSNNHELRKVNTLSEFQAIVADRKQKDQSGLESGNFPDEFIKEQQVFADLRYHALFLKKINSLYRSPELTDEWMDQFKNTDFQLTNETARRSEWFYEILKDYVCIKRFVLEGVNPQDVAESFNTFFFDNYCEILGGENLEYALACLLHDDVYQKDFSKDIPSLYDRFISLFPHSAYAEILEPEAKMISDLYNQDSDNSKIQLVDYETEPESFEEMVRPYSGKVVYVDLWATWCAPCLESLQKAGNLKEKLSGLEDVVVFYISLDRDNAHEKWQQLINYYNLEGYHYRVNKHTTEIIHTSLGDSNGALMIPRYVIVDKQGKIAFPEAASPSDLDQVVEQLKSLLK